MSTLSVTSALFAPAISRPVANFHPTVWGDHFIQYVSKPTDGGENVRQQIETLKEKVRAMLIPVNKKALQPVMIAKLIDSIQRLGLCHHYEHEIDEVLQHIYDNYVDDNNIITLNEEDDLHSIALVFRLLRQQGYRILPNVFNKFKDEKGNFDQYFATDVEGMLSLYEAAHLRIHGEGILDEALMFTSSHFESIITQLDPSFAAKVKNSLKRPLLKNLPRLVARHYISTYEEESSYDETLLLLAKLDFNMLQKQHQRELGIISKWWKDLDFARKLPFARDKVVEIYFWVLGVNFEPQYSLGRRLMTKVVTLISTIDDIYDVYGTLDELQLFTEAIERWDMNSMDILPEYMKPCYQAVLDAFDEIEQEMAKEGRTYAVIYAKNEMKRLIQAYFAEAKWCNSKYIPTIEEYMEVASISCAYRVLMVLSFIGCFATEKAFQWLIEDHKIIKATLTICRLMDDIASNEFEQEREHVASAVQCYMKQHGVAKQYAIDELRKQITSAWKDVNEECLNLTSDLPKPLIMRFLNLSRAMDVLYKDGDCYTQSQGSTKNNIEALLLNPCSIQGLAPYHIN